MGRVVRDGSDGGTGQLPTGSSGDDQYEKGDVRRGEAGPTCIVGDPRPYQSSTVLVHSPHEERKGIGGVGPEMAEMGQKRRAGGRGDGRRPGWAHNWTALRGSGPRRLGRLKTANWGRIWREKGRVSRRVRRAESQAAERRFEEKSYQ
jgi:hypothetical protein